MWKTVEYNKKQINAAGKKISTNDISEQEKRQYLDVIDNWRAAHAFPMNTFAINLRHQVEDIEGAIVVQRLKRLETIIGKIQRYPEMALYRMQDIAGCRVILPTIEQVYAVKKKLQSSRIRHELHNEKDYIAIPNPDTGYRGIHLIYRYKSDKRTDYNGMQVEIQLRTHLQHIWATAVETVGKFTDNELKFNSGSKDWLEFFKLTSALFSIEESSAVVEGVSNDSLKIYSDWLILIDKLNVIATLGAIGLATQQLGHISTGKKTKKGYYLIKLYLDPISVEIEEFMGMEKGLELATEAYKTFEQQKEYLNKDCVLVSAESYEALVDAYPNYFMDVNKFLKVIHKIIKKYDAQLKELLDKNPFLDNLYLV